jgi:hypothetical protein
MLFVSLYFPFLIAPSTEGAIRNGKYRDTNNIDHKKTEGAIRNGKYRDTNNIDHKKTEGAIRNVKYRNTNNIDQCCLCLCIIHS